MESGVGGAPPLGPAASGLLPLPRSGAPCMAVPCPPTGLGDSAWDRARRGAGGPEPCAHRPRPAEGTVAGQERDGTGGKGAGAGAVAGGRPGRVCAGRLHFIGRRGRAPGTGVSASPGSAGPGLRDPGALPAAAPALSRGRYQNATFLCLGPAGPRFGARRSCEANSRKQSGALQRTEGPRLARQLQFEPCVSSPVRPGRGREAPALMAGQPLTVGPTPASMFVPAGETVGHCQ